MSRFFPSDGESDTDDESRIPAPLPSYNQCFAAIEGKAVPEDITSTIERCSMIRGLRSPKFACARNARLIMTNVIPGGLEDPVLQPYCIWHPDFAGKDTYRQLAHQ
ncbi:hypothetical protein PENCOP_c012G03817 [Penicillium coprophilum]|uniref:Uncharacterized protein n=1 Tax=Penicillium coprophilum TaxID=36646 RepID=A0A1V6UCI5_9EURO|nr:hypothetical protein PENCOP_c012G03817 [Penicillium coprophilum]